ncbi:alpha/beta fold hydrolase [Streptomyces sp. CC210A]|uniref:alpha/beta fold hydrolase n=1 Tax=Streptomyces sp. CC210A TaxID=2898184 RepID=UPI001F444DC7|nr:alpha/beta fold hydrolase [Streptomyces sp. CC210A]
MARCVGVAGALAALGHRAVPLTLTGLGDRRHLAGPQVGLGTHVEDVVAALDHEEPDGDGQLVVVGHSYGIFPVLGAVDRRAERVGRVVFLDTGVPQDGESLEDAFMDAGRRAAVRQRVRERGDGWRWPVPADDEVAYWGSRAGLDGGAAARLRRLAVDQPYATMTEPLRLTGAVWQVPTSGVLCAGSGVGIDVLRALYASGDPRYAGLAGPRVSFFELPTGHYPMLSAPSALAAALVEAAEGGGTRIGATAG